MQIINGIVSLPTAQTAIVLTTNITSLVLTAIARHSGIEIIGTDKRFSRLLIYTLLDRQLVCGMVCEVSRLLCLMLIIKE